MTESIKALSRIFLVIVKIDLESGDCIVIKNGEDRGLDLDGVTCVRDLNQRLSSYLCVQTDAPRLESFLTLSTLKERFSGKVHLREDFRFRETGWGRAGLIRDEEREEGRESTCLFNIFDVDKEKQEDIRKQKELERHNLLLKEALAVANHANQAKTTFLNSMSHDIRTPMNAIIGFTSLAATHIDNRKAVESYLQKITVSSNHLLSLINDVLDMSRIESGRTKLDEKEVRLPDVLHDLRSIVHSSVQGKQLDFFIDTQDVLYEIVMVDKLRLNQVLLNILGNAIKFTPPRGTVSLRVIENPCSRTGYAEYEFRIKDTGIGMSKEYQQHIFEPFSREESSMVSSVQGSGLGMAITKNIVDMMNGAIAVSSEEGAGTEFTVILDLKIAGDAVSQEVIPELNNMHTLVADDDFNTCSSVSKMLTTIGMRPEWTTSGKEAILRTRFAKEAGDEFRAFIIDWLMPDMNGIEVVRRIRSEVGDSTPIIILTAYEWSAIEEEAREAGVTGFCSKPLFLSELREVLSRPFVKREEKKREKEEMDMSIFQGRRILLAEDNELNRELAEAIFTEVGFELEIAENGKMALDMLVEHEAGYYDLLITDIQMPVMNGYELSLQVRALKDESKSQIPVFALTANAFEEDRVQVMEAKMNGHLTKPIDIKEVLSTIRGAMK